MVIPDFDASKLEWATLDLNDVTTGNQDNKIEPNNTKKDYGWSFLEKPPFNYFNYWQNLVYQHIKHLNEDRRYCIQIQDLTEDTAIGSSITTCFDILFNESSKQFLVAGDSGILVKSSNGNLWSVVSVPFGTDDILVLGQNESTVLAGTDGAKLARSTDGGETFGSLITNPFSTDIIGIKYIDDTWIIWGDSNKLAYSTDDGLTWSALVTLSDFTGSDIVYDIIVGTTALIAIGGDSGITSIMMKSLDKGATWTTVATNPFDGTIIYQGISGIYYNNQFIIGSFTGEVSVSSDEGLTWSTATSILGTITQISLFGDGFILFCADATAKISNDNLVSYSFDFSLNGPITSPKFAYGNNMFIGIDIGTSDSFFYSKWIV